MIINHRKAEDSLSQTTLNADPACQLAQCYALAVSCRQPMTSMDIKSTHSQQHTSGPLLDVWAEGTQSKLVPQRERVVKVRGNPFQCSLGEVSNFCAPFVCEVLAGGRREM